MQSKREFDYKKDENSLRVVSHFIGNTPFVKLSDKLYGKLEAVNPGGSIKDRPVKYIIDNAEKNNKLKKGDTIVEATSGNTGISLAMMCAERGYKCIIIMPSNMSEERKKMLRFFGAQLVEVGEGDFDGAIELKEKLTKENNYFTLNQFNNNNSIIEKIKENANLQKLAALLGVNNG